MYIRAKGRKGKERKGEKREKDRPFVRRKNMEFGKDIEEKQERKKRDKNRRRENIGERAHKIN